MAAQQSTSDIISAAPTPAPTPASDGSIDIMDVASLQADLQAHKSTVNCIAAARAAAGEKPTELTKAREQALMEQTGDKTGDNAKNRAKHTAADVNKDEDKVDGILDKIAAAIPDVLKPAKFDWFEDAEEAENQQPKAEQIDNKTSTDIITEKVDDVQQIDKLVDAQKTDAPATTIDVTNTIVVEKPNNDNKQINEALDDKDIIHLDISEMVIGPQKTDKPVDPMENTAVDAADINKMKHDETSNSDNPSTEEDANKPDSDDKSGDIEDMVRSHLATGATAFGLSSTKYCSASNLVENLRPFIPRDSNQEVVQGLFRALHNISSRTANPRMRYFTLQPAQRDIITLVDNGPVVEFNGFTWTCPMCTDRKTYQGKPNKTKPQREKNLFKDFREVREQMQRRARGEGDQAVDYVAGHIHLKHGDYTEHFQKEADKLDKAQQAVQFLESKFGA